MDRPAIGPRCSASAAIASTSRMSAVSSGVGDGEGTGEGDALPLRSAVQASNATSARTASTRAARDSRAATVHLGALMGPRWAAAVILLCSLRVTAEAPAAEPTTYYHPNLRPPRAVEPF